MSTPLLTTKLYIPPLRPSLVSRPRLVRRLDAGVQAGHCLTLVSAPAGFGKTTLVGEWAQGRREATSPLPVTWISLDEGDNDPVRFLTYLLAALQGIDPDLGQAAQSLLGAPQLPPVDALMTLLINDIAAVPSPFVLVLDDYHLIRAPLIHDALTFLLEHPPPRMHLVLTTRRDPPLPLPRLRVRGQMTEIRAQDLRFTAEEAAAFLNQALGLTLAPEIVTALEARTEGWIAGLQMASLSMQGKPAERVADFVTAFSGSDRHVIDYLAEEVLARQPGDIRDFLRQAAILDRLTAPLCDAVTGRDDSDAVLNQLERAGLFLIPLDAEHTWYRYHRLFADFLRTEIDLQHAPALHIEAARWFETNGLLPEAAEHALASGDMDEASRIVILAAGQALIDGALVTLLGWVDALPDEVVRSNPDLATLKAWALCLTGQVEAGSSYARSAEGCLPGDGDPLRRGRLVSLRCYAADIHDVLQLARQALDLIGDADPFARSGTLFMLGDAQDAVGNVSEAIQAFREALHLGERYHNRLVAAMATGHLAFSLNSQGRRREAVALCQRAIGQTVDAQGRPLPLVSLIYVALGTLAHEADDLVEARRHLEQGLELGRQSAATRVILCAMEELAQLQHAVGETEAALAAIQEAHRLAVQAGEFERIRTSAAAEAALQLHIGNVHATERWASSADLPIAHPPDLARKYEYPVHVRLLLAQGRPEEARALLVKLERLAEEGDRRRSLITIFIQQALAEQMLGHQAAARSALEKAVRLSAPEDYRRAFLDEGPLVAGLLARLEHVAPAFVDHLLMAFRIRAGRDVSSAVAGPLSLIEPLSEREIQVLRLLAAELSGPEIAEELVIAVSTVRSHVKSIYAKLDVHSRYEAVQRAKVLGLL
jgi:LuxR family maltose regulon positive regulatory protein